MNKKILVLIIILLLCAAVFFYYSQPSGDKLSDREKEEAVANLLGRKAKINPVNEKTGNATFEGKYITFEYPAKAIIYEFKNEDSKDETNEESFSFDIKSPKIIFNMQTKPFEASLEDIPSVRLRNDRSYEYTKKEVTIGKVKGITYTKSGNEPEKSGFFIANGRIYTISVIGSAEEYIVKLFDDVISTVSFSAGETQL